MNTFHHFQSLIRPYRARAGFAVLITLSACLLNAPVLLAIFAGQAALTLASTCITGEIGLGIVRGLRHRLYAWLQWLSLAYYDRTPPGAIISRLMFALRLPHGYATMVGEGGHKLSQGERQRVALARIFCKDPALVVLDEATSSLDPESEVLVQAALANLFRDRTAFIVAHRLGTVMDADLLVVLDGGLIVQSGTHAELLTERDGLYARLCAHQFGGIDLLRDRPVKPRRFRFRPVMALPVSTRTSA